MAIQQRERGQVVVIEIILLLALLITILALYQAFGVPDQNRQVEFEHNQDVQSDLIDLRGSLLDIRSANEAQISREHRSVRVRLGLQYPPRIVGINPTDPRGTLETQEYGEISIDGAAVDGDFEGDPEANLLNVTHDTRLLVYEPGYNEYRNAPTTVFEHSMVYNRLEASDRSLTNQRVVKGDSGSVNLVLFDGDINERSDEKILDPETLDGPTERVPITAIEPGEDIEIVLPTKSPDVWKSDRAIGETFDEGELGARAAASDDREVTITLDGEESWNLQMTRVGFDGGTSDDTLSSIRETEEDPLPGEHDPVWGPNVDINEDSIPTRETGDEIDLTQEITGEISSIGSETRLRSGTPIQSVEYTVTDAAGDEYTSGTVTSLNPDADDAKRLWPIEELPGAVIETDEWEPDEYTVTITAQDASGRITDETEADSFDVEVESDELFVDADVSDLVAGESGQTQTFEFELGQDLGNERVTINIRPANDDVNYPGAQGNYEVVSGSGTANIWSAGNPREIRYEATPSDTAGDRIVIEVAPITVPDGTVDEVYEISFSARGGDEVITAEFSIFPDD